MVERYHVYVGKKDELLYLKKIALKTDNDVDVEIAETAAPEIVENSDDEDSGDEDLYN